jgi:hypothetical protein
MRATRSAFRRSGTLPQQLFHGHPRISTGPGAPVPQRTAPGATVETHRTRVYAELPRRFGETSRHTKNRPVATSTMVAPEGTSKW